MLLSKYLITRCCFPPPHSLEHFDQPLMAHSYCCTVDIGSFTLDTGQEVDVTIVNSDAVGSTYGHVVQAVATPGAPSLSVDLTFEERPVFLAKFNIKVSGLLCILCSLGLILAGQHIAHLHN